MNEIKQDEISVHKFLIIPSVVLLTFIFLFITIL